MEIKISLFSLYLSCSAIRNEFYENSFNFFLEVIYYDYIIILRVSKGIILSVQISTSQIVIFTDKSNFKIL